MPDNPENTRINAISITYDGSEWHVLVQQDGHRPVARTFKFEAYAWNYAQCQMKRLNLREVTRV